VSFDLSGVEFGAAAAPAGAGASTPPPARGQEPPGRALPSRQSSYSRPAVRASRTRA
jgi:hypothetical protein